MSDAHQSVLQIPSLGSGRVYCVYGFHQTCGQPAALLAFNGEYAEAQTGNYLLGKGNRSYNPVLMRFHSADPFSPFGQGGLNSYAYCLGDPINNIDPTGNWPWSRPKKTPSDSGKVMSNSTLKNVQLDRLPEEVHTFNNAVEQGLAKVVEIKGKNDLVNIEGESPEQYTKFIFTKDGRFFTVTYDLKKVRIDHPALAEHVRGNFSASSEVASAGALIVRGGKKKYYFLKNWSGHYRPALHTLKPAREYLKRIGIEAASMHYDEL